MWGGASISDQEKQVFNLGKKFRLYTQLDSIANNTEVEKGLVIVRWKKKSKDNEESEADAIFAENEFIANKETKTVDFCKTRASDMKYKMRLFAPKAASEKLKSNLQQLREAMDEIFYTYKEEVANKNGNIRKYKTKANNLLN